MLHFFARRMKESREDERGFTLIELLVVVIIIGILAAIAIPTFLGQRARAQDASAKSLVRNGATAMESHFTDTQKYSTATKVILEGIEPSTTFEVGAGAAAEDVVRVTSTTDPVSNPGGYTLVTKSKSGATVTLTKTPATGKVAITP